MPELLKEFSWWRDTLDILVVAFIIYRVLLLIQGTRAVQMLKGFSVIFLVYFISQKAELLILHWILTNFLSSIILVIIVIFQHDIRRALTRVGTVPFFTYSETVDESRVIDEIMKAAVSLANKKIGALIVLEREIGLKDYVDIGVKLDAAVNKEVLHSIFLPNSPIHDGAIIIQDGRITAAGALLPLTANPVFDKSLGTRHKAAMGLTEETDAVVIVVSEERGRTSIVEGGIITQDLDTNILKENLLRHFRKKGHKGLASGEK
ncbi:MAG: diadenylate cyclase CdaA [Deltaproteobacteria bacterium]|nr:diadenylate cyclase CdaA [Deltaproteobacteria bacterium]